MGQVFNEINRITKDNSQVIFIVGRESQVRKTTFRNGEIVAEVACGCCGLKLSSRQERVFLNRYGTRIYEDILHFNSSSGATYTSNSARTVADKLLKSVINEAPDESQADLRDAIEKIPNIESSEYFEPITGAV
jgi:hypothetical protein